ncbi:neuronal growth regulator 1 isoform X2 [Rana temporaria]|uniref:neuronal growth regulator 1 isoform X2 n=1 Tax=Rana temporaria TaxID=8407 RepID=UPI001AAE0217|nr:neuronal growth regulator 1 isoform X2 [Rana temporaria]
MDMMMLVQGAACCSNQWLAAVILSVCCLLPSCLPAGQGMDYPWPAVPVVDNLVVRQGETAMLRCILEDGASKGAWLNRSSIIFAGNDKWSVDPRVSISASSKKDYNLRIQKVEISDDGMYTCSVQTEHSPRTMQIILTVQVSPKIFEISPSMIVNEGTNVSLTCLASGKPEPSISWRHISPSDGGIRTLLISYCAGCASAGSQKAQGNANIPEIGWGTIRGARTEETDFGEKERASKPFGTGQYLDIYGITRDQAGDYECLAENAVPYSDVKKVNVVVNFAPTILEITPSGVSLGKTGLIRCETAAVPAPTFEWYKGERKLTNGQKGILIKNYSTRSILHVSNVTEEHFGNYTCVAVNKLGTSNASLPLNPPSTAQYGITGRAEILFSCWYLVLTLSSFTSIIYLKNIIIQ